MITPLAFQSTAKRDKSEIEPGDLLTVLVRKDDGYVECGARATRCEHGLFWVTIVGLSVPKPYFVGCKLTLEADRVIDW